MTPNKLTIAVQDTIGLNTPTTQQFEQWVQRAVNQREQETIVSLRIVTIAEMTNLNREFRQQAKPTNVLAFPMHVPPDWPMDTPLLGDIALCAEVIAQEAITQSKPADAHWAHMVIHGVLHLLGFDHQTTATALEMETLEIELLADLGYSNPYQKAPS